MLQIWDTFLYEGSKVLFRYAIALFKSNEEQLLKLDSPSALFNQIRRMGKLAYDPQRLSQVSSHTLYTLEYNLWYCSQLTILLCPFHFQIAFKELSSFPMRIVNQKRAMHVKQVEVGVAVQILYCVTNPSH